MPYLFLDFDGVMHPEWCNDRMYFCRRGLFEPWLRARPGIEVVISSAWREKHSRHELRNFFSEDLRQRIIGETPVLTQETWEEYGGEMPPIRFQREVEVTQWLHASSEPWQVWAALDDRAWLYKPFHPRLVLCDGRVGLTPYDLNRLDSLLGTGGA